ncbi:DUF5677 domain-containing protein [Vibrio splendidus]|uniref:DUF5677 domain-containing protein n=1 Tax=Vibrio splendidus TaxID=29497 RepID=UPI001FB37DEC|nr:DUF5677 domain-containing protein [Vibrio splendidus]UOE82193.1 DUF5677 domain-containing protein [Vibrio splendidus]
MNHLQSLVYDFDKIAEIAADLSMHFGGVRTDDKKRRYSTYFLAKLVHNCVSLLKILPNSSEDKEYFDLSSIASLSRNIIESTNLCWYYCIEDVELEESSFRFLLFDYHDVCTTISLSESFDWKLDAEEELKEEKLVLLEAIKNTSQYFNEGKAEQKKLRQGRKASMCNQSELIEARGVDCKEFKGIYKLLSNHVHTTPNAINSVVHSRSHGQEMDTVLCGLILTYACIFCAEMVRTIGDIWQMEFAKEESRQLIESYSKQLF